VSRSRRNVPIRGIAGDSDKQDKARSSRALRHAIKNALKQGKEIPDEKEYRDPWGWSKDGKIYCNNDVDVLRK